MGGHALPEVEQEALNLNGPTYSMRFGSTDNDEIHSKRGALASSKLARMTVSSILWQWVRYIMIKVETYGR